MTRFRQAGGRGHGERGAALIELALLLPFLSLLLYGTIELSMAWVTDNRVEGAAAQAARVAASDGSRVEADRDVLVTLRAALPSEVLAAADRVVVFKATDATGAVPPGCIKALNDPSEIGTSLCNTYSGTTLRSVTAASMTGFGGTGGTKDAYWAPATRNDALVDPPDYVGVWVRTQHRALTKFGFSTITVVASSVTRIQPDING
jgi:Flp pilus assembly pilin Flp